MATTSAVLNPDISREGILTVGDTIIYSCPNKYMATILSLTFNNASAFDISLRLERYKTSTSTGIYTFNLDAGDVMQDSNIYVLYYGDKIVATTGVANTSYAMKGQVAPKF
jgi:hypothetical protein